jgi:mannosyltransferase
VDEAWSWAWTHLSFPDLLRLSLGYPHPPLYHSLLKTFLPVLPNSEFGLRAFAAGASILSLAAVLAYVGSRWNTETMVYVGLLMALSPFDIYFAQDARMYTLLALLWIGSYISLVRALEGDRIFRIVWPISAILMAWTHLYGVLAAFTQIVFVGGYILAGGRPKVDWQLVKNGRALLPSAACVALGALPPLSWALSRVQEGAGGAWVPGPKDLLALFLLWSTGLTPVRAYFLDNAHLVLPALAGLSMAAWILVGMATGGLPAMWGLFHTWRTESSRRAEVLLAIILMALPVTLAYGYGAITASRAWAFKSLLGAAYLFYLWAGVGIGSLKAPWLRRCLGATIVVVAVASLCPYFTTWQKSDAAAAFHSLPVLTDRDGVVVEPAGHAPLVFFYTSEAVRTYAIVPRAGQKSLVRLLRPDKSLIGVEDISCEDISSITALWVYPYDARTRNAMREWPACVTTKTLWGFQQGRWQRLEP